MLTTLLSILTNRILWSFLGVTALSAVIWMIGPLLSIVDTRPLESEQNRIISIAVVYLLWAQGHILPRLYNAWLNRKLMDKLNENTAKPDAADPQKRLNSEEQILAGRFDEAAQMLKKPTSAKRDTVPSGRSASVRNISTSCRGTSLSAHRAPVKPRRWSIPACNSRWRIASVKPLCAALAAPATATGGSLTKPSCWTPRGATPLRRASRFRMPGSGWNLSACCVSIAAASLLTASLSPSAFPIC